MGLRVNMIKRPFVKKFVSIALICLILVALMTGFVACGREQNALSDGQVRNLLKLSRVWGFTVFTHQAFITGERCWDEELLELIPVIKVARENEVNGILYEWFIGLGDDGYDLNAENLSLVFAERFPYSYDVIMDFFEDEELIEWWDVWCFFGELHLYTTGHEINLRHMANLDWINENYLGLPLASALTRFNMIQNMDLSQVYIFLEMGFNPFDNPANYSGMNFDDYRYRLLGLFRLWNIVNYFFPYLDIIDGDWCASLMVHIPKIYEGYDRLTYISALLSLSASLHDAHIQFFDVSGRRPFSIFSYFFTQMFGSYFAPVSVTEAGGSFVVSGFDIGYEYSVSLLRGDIILRLNGIDINEVAADMLKYLPYPNDEKALQFLIMHQNILRQSSGLTPMKICVLRANRKVTLYINAVFRDYHDLGLLDVSSLVPTGSHVTHELLENNIGIIYPRNLIINFDNMYCSALLNDILSELSDAYGIIIDLRQGGSPGVEVMLGLTLAEFLHSRPTRFSIGSEMLGLAPGVFIDLPPAYSGPGVIFDTIGYDVESFFFDRPVVVTVDERVFSAGESVALSLRNSPNVTLMGTNTIGANGTVVFALLPGGFVTMLSGVAIFTPEGGQTQRIGITPDIVVERTIDGIRDERDEVMDAAIHFLIGKMLPNG